jgi:archaellum component FlaF (FlaF/FlaG flagellin family)
MSKKMCKKFIIETIQYHFAKNNQIITNLSRETMPFLDGIIKKYNINIEETYKNMLAEREERRAKNQLEGDQQVAKLKLERDQRLEMYNHLTTEEKDELIKNIFEKVNAETIASKEKSKSSTDKMYNVFKSEGAIVERISDTELKVNGVVVQNNVMSHLSELITYEDFVTSFNTRIEFYLRNYKSELEEIWGREFVIVWKKH